MEWSKKVKIIVGVTTITITLVIIIITTIAIVLDHSCRLQVRRPVYDDGNLKGVISADNRNILKLSGYIEYKNYYDPEKVEFGPLDARSIDVIEINGGNRIRMYLHTNCAKMEFNFELNKVIGDFRCSFVKITPIGSNSQIKLCIINPVINFNDHLHYSCDTPKRFTCYYSDGSIIYVVFDHLEFEINGNPSIISRGGFSTRSIYCNSV